ncbi:hypothetical protein ScPMuIL_007793, partial [Solemya velum]
PSSKSFADVTRVAKPASTRSVSVQTDMTWPEQLPTFALLLTIQPKTVTTVSATQTTSVTHPKITSGTTPAAKLSLPPKPTVTTNKIITLTPTTVIKPTQESSA